MKESGTTDAGPLTPDYAAPKKSLQKTEMSTDFNCHQVVDVVRRVIHGWDPFELIRNGAPADEWDDEIAKLVTKIPTIRSADEAARALSSVFSSAFQPEGFGPSDCATVGRQLYDVTNEAGLAPSRR